MADTEDAAALTISPDKVCFIVIKAREFDGKDALTDVDDGSNATDDGMRGVLEDGSDDPVRSELTDAIRGLNEDEQIDLVALTWLGRGDDVVGNWTALREQARSRREGSTARYLLGIPLLADYLEEGLDLMGLSCDDVEAAHL
jgi:hypothetical protein